jgi:putative methionine-R-sulfoxide reductase with GAF domain
MEYFDENSGFSTEGFRMGSCLKSSSGELFWGNRSGINYYYPEQLKNHPVDLKVNIHQGSMHDSTFYVGGDTSILLYHGNNNITFHFTAVNLTGSHNVQYKYILDGYEKEWQTGKDIHQARYASLPPGNYTFKVKASIDGLKWVDSNNMISVYIAPPIWRQWWFLLFTALFITGIIFLIAQARRKTLHKQKEELEIQQAINYFASGIYEQQTVESILWDVAKNCIGRLQFEDCVVYLLDEKRNVLVQKAAHGPKSPHQYVIDHPIEIPIGHGIVGCVAASGEAEVVNDTTKDARYIVDDQVRYSEISVPIKTDGKVLGVIDCEHSKKGFFTQKHLSILTTIASLCANKIVRTNAEKEKEQAQLVLMDTQRKMTEVEMHALRAQMNPHFIFNCLNSINRYIVKSDQVTASLYLTKFAKLIRLILDNSNNKNVILSHELEALKLYIEMEALRFDKKFSYSITVDHNVNADSIEVPPLIIQPYVENAIWHGLLHKDEPGCLHIHVSMPEENVLQCIIEDDGVGREKARELKSKTATTRKSLGMKLTEHRLNLLNNYAELNASIDIIDLRVADEAKGTKVILKIPV